MPPGPQPTPPSSTSSNGASPDTPQFRVVRKRNRVPLSCAPCRHRKLKCNRGHPCDNCSKRGDMASCNYAAPKTRKASSVGSGNAEQSPDDMQNRIDRLEGLVLSLMTNGQGQPMEGGATAARAAIHSSRSNSLSTASDLRLDVEGTDMIREEGENGDEDSEVEQVSKGIGIMKVDNTGRAMYASDAHWYAILAEIGEVKRYFDNHKEDYTNHLNRVNAAKAREKQGTAFLLQGNCAASSKEEILAQFPPKVDSDRLIARYFNAYDPSVHIIHGPSFQKEYDAHWMNPSATPVVWLGMCFAMMTLSLQSYHRAGDEPPEYQGRSLESSHDFRRLTAQCLLLGDITQPLPQVLETLVLHVQAEYGRSRDAEPSVLLMTCLCVRLALRMGYHRDPGPHPSITPFQAEMRRRVWTFIRQCDLLISFQFGLPAMVRSDHIDTLPPRNLYDDELHEDLQALPASRPSFEATPMTYMIAKSKMTFLFGKLVERVQSLTDPPSYEETMKFDQDLREMRAAHPPLLRMRSFHDSSRDPANLIMQRLGLELIYLRSLFVLHRRFIARGRDNPRFAYSRRTCIDASMEMLAHQATLHEESQPGGRLRSVKWYISSLTTHDFLLASVNVCMDLYHVAETERRRNRSAPTSPPPLAADHYDGDRRDAMMRAVEHCITIWESVREQSMEAYKASVALRVMVDKLKHLQLLQTQQISSAAVATTGLLDHHGVPNHNVSRGAVYGLFPNGSAAGMGADDLPPEQSAAMTLGLLSSGGMSPGPGFSLQNLAAEAQQQSQQRSAGYPVGMNGLLNAEPVNDRTGYPDGYGSGLTPGADVLAGDGGPASPFSQMFGAGGFGGFGGLDAMGGGDIDWSAWDSYIQGTGGSALDPNLTGLWPMNLDPPNTGDEQLQGMNGQQPQIQQQQTQPAGGGATFMGAGTPG
ncbi:hypothetical protein LTR95_002782 [Oleoguttula sp. CCFEE 5521]